MSEDTCPGKMYNGPGKRYTRCDKCGAVDYEANEGDRCGRPLKGKTGVARSKKAPKEESMIDKTTFNRLLGGDRFQLNEEDTANHFIDADGKIYVDTTFLNKVQYEIKGAHLKSMGFGEFSLETPEGEVEFDRMRGKPFPGQSGRSHQMYDSKGGQKIAEKIVKQMEKAGKSKTAKAESVLPEGEDGVAETIVKQMGGMGRIKAMLGAKFVEKLPGGKGIGIRWPSKEPSKGNHVEITLRPDDTYDMEFFNVSAKTKKKSVKKYEGVYADQLIEIFERQTGWYLRMSADAPRANLKEDVLAKVRRLFGEEARSLSVIASEIRKDWVKVNYAAKPYLDAMSGLDKITDSYGADDARSIVNYFLANATSWRGPKAKEIKAELKTLAEAALKKAEENR